MIAAKVLAILALVMIVLTAGCGLTIHFGGEQFKNAITGHMTLGIIAVLLALATVVSVFSLT